MDMPSWLQGLWNGIPNLGPPGPTGAPRPLGPMLPSMPNFSMPQGGAIDTLSGGLLSAGGLLNRGIDVLTGGGGVPQTIPPTGPNLPPSPMNVPSASSVPAINTRPRTGGLGGPVEFNFPGSKLPDAPLMQPPPQMASPSGVDFSRSRGFAAKAEPGPLNMEGLNALNVSNVLGGLAKGAGSVSATEPGSFAKALAAAGAGGAEGRGSAIEKGEAARSAHDAAMQRYNEQRSNQEMHMAQMQAEMANAKRQTDFQNAKLLWDTDFQNRKAIYDQQLQQYGLDQPKLGNYNEGVSMTTTNPDGSKSIKLIPTKSTQEHLEQIFKFMSGAGLDPTMAQLTAIRGMGYPPDVEQHETQKAIIRNIASNPVIASTTFGADYDNAAKAVDARLKSDRTFSLMQMNPSTAAKAIDERNKMIADALHDAFIRSGTNEWQQKLAKSSYGNWLLPNIVGGANSPPPM